MKKIFLGVFVGIMVLIVSGVAGAEPRDKAGEKGIGPWKFVPDAPNNSIRYRDIGNDLIQYEVIHYKNKKDFVRPETAKAAKLPTCYKFLTPTKVKWTTLPVNYVINPTNPQGLAETFIDGAVFNSAETWDAATSKELMNNTFTTDGTAAYGVQNYKNAIVFGNYSTAGVIAVTSVWYNTRLGKIVEFDMMFDTDWVWGDATVDPTKMDLQNIATHELGHAVGLADAYNSACSAATMYGYSDYGDVQKRTLESPDIKGLQTLYGI